MAPSTTPIRVVALLCLAISGCGGSQTTDSSLPSSEPLPAAAEKELEALFEATTDFQKTLLADGVTRQEYESAALQTRDCLESGGLRVDLTLGHPVITMTAGEISIGGGVFGPTSPVVLDCYREYLDAVEARFLLDNTPSRSDLEAETERFYECLRQKGYPIPDDAARNPATGDVVDAAEYDDLVECWDMAGS